MPKTAPNRRNKSHKPQTLPTKFRPGFLSSLDKRTDLARSLRQNLDTIINEQGGPDSLSHTKRALIERFVWLEAVLQSIEHELVSTEGDKAATLSRWVQALNTLSGLAKTIGVERKVTTIPWLAPAARPEGSVA